MAQSSPYQCADIKSSPERLACYDSFFAKNKNLPAKKNTPIEKKEEVLSFDKKNELKKGKQKDKSNERTFGLSFKQLRKANLIPEKEEVKIFSSITKATKQITKKLFLDWKMVMFGNLNLLYQVAKRGNLKRAHLLS